MKIDLANKIILVTGASSGIGKEIAIQLANSGATVAIHYNSNKKQAEEIAKQAGNKSMIFQANLENIEQTKQLFNSVLKHYSKLDVLVNNAGVFMKSPIEQDHDIWISDWDKTLNINLKSAALLSKMVINHFLKTKNDGRIIHIASRAAFRGDLNDYLAYAASKGAMVSLSKSIARSFGKQNLKSFVVAPGFVYTPMAEPFINEAGEEFILNELSLNELTKPEDIAPTVVLMASGYMDHATGCSVDINAGSYMR